MSVAGDRPAEHLHLFRRMLPPGNLSASLYGLILVMSVLATLGPKGVDDLGIALVVTAFVFALAHAWARALGHAAEARLPVDRRAFRHSLKQEWPIVTAAIPSAVLVGLAGLDVYSTDTGVWLASIANVVLLFVWGAGMREVAGASVGQVLGAGLSSATLGLILVGLKVLVH